MGKFPETIETLRGRGSWRAKTRQQTTASVVETLPMPPEWLTSEERARFDALVRKLADRGLCGAVDGLPLARYCRTVSHWQATADYIQKHGLSYTGPKGRDVVRPQVAMLQKLAGLMIEFEDRFGLSPKSRARIRPVAPSQESADPADRFFTQGGTPGE